jgi:hypothetical protein
MFPALDLLSDDILLNIFQKAVIDLSCDDPAYQGQAVMGRLPQVCRRFRKLIASFEFLAWDFTADVEKDSFGDLASCLSGRVDPRFKTMLLSVDSIGLRSYLRHADSLAGLLMTSRLSLSELILGGVRLTEEETETEQDIAVSRLSMLLKILQQCSKLRTLDLGFDHSSDYPPCTFAISFQSLRILKISGYTFTLTTQGFDEMLPSLEILELDGPRLDGNNLKASRLLSLRLDDTIEKLEASKLRDLVMRPTSSGEDRCTLSCPDLRRLEFSARSPTSIALNIESSLSRTSTTAANVAKKQSLKFLDVSSLVDACATEVVSTFERVDILVVKDGFQTNSFNVGRAVNWYDYHVRKKY